MVGSVAGDLPEQVKNNKSVNLAAGNGGQKMSQYSWFTVYFISHRSQQTEGAAQSSNLMILRHPLHTETNFLLNFVYQVKIYIHDPIL